MMARIPWMVRPNNMLVVSKTPGSSYKTVQGALDAIESAGDATFTNRYVVVIEGPDVYEEQVFDESSHVDVVGVGWPTIARFSSDIGSQPNGTYTVGDSLGAVTVTDKTLSGIRFVRDISGLSKVGNPPEAALYIGAENVEVSTQMWDRIAVTGNIIEGVHDGIQMFGPNYLFAGTPGLLELRGNLIRSVHDAVTVKGAMRVDSAHNTIEVDASGRSPWLTDIGNWKSTGFHINQNRSADVSGNPDTDWASLQGDRYLRSTGDSIRMICTDNVVGSSAEEIFAAYLTYDQGSFTDGSNTSPHRYHIESPSIHMIYDADEAPSENIAAFMSYHQDIGATGSANSFVVSGGNALLEQRNTGVSSPATVYGVHVSGGNGSEIKILGTLLEVTNAKGGGNAYWGTVAVGDTIKHDVYSDQAPDPGAGGTLTKVASK